MVLNSMKGRNSQAEKGTVQHLEFLLAEALRRRSDEIREKKKAKNRGE